MSRVMSYAVCIAVLLLLSAAVCGCVSQSGKATDTGTDKGSTDHIADGNGKGDAKVTDLGAIVIERSGIIKIPAFDKYPDDVICENIISPSILIADGLYPMIDFEMSFITVLPNHETPLHLLKDTCEMILITSGTADMMINDRLMNAEAGTLVYVPMNTPMTVRNNGKSDLKYISITNPPYNPENEIFDGDKEYDTLHVKSENATAIIIDDVEPDIFFKDVKVANLINPAILKEYNQNYNIGCGIAYVTIPEGSGTDPHIIEGTTEVDQILKGQGEIVVNSKIMSFKEGDTVYIQSGARQSVTNTGSGDLIFLAVTDPPYNPSADSSVKTN